MVKQKIIIKINIKSFFIVKRNFFILDVAFTIKQ